MDDTIIVDSVIQKYFAGETSEQEEKYLLAWLEESEEHRKYFFELKSLWGARRVFEESTDLAHFASFMRSTGHRIGKIAAGERYARRRKLVRWTLGAAAAVLLAVCAGTAWLFFSAPKIYRVYENTGDAVTTVTLDDGTHVWLNAGTKLIYPKQFNRSMRQVYLSGENLFTHSPMFKHTDMFDPEVITSGDSDFAASTTSGLNGTGNGYSYPMLKTVTLGINVTF